MSFEVGNILLFRNFKLPLETKDKFFIVLDQKEDEYTLMSMTTSKQYIHDEKLKHGMIEDGDVVVYCFMKDVLVGENGFSFRKNTFVSTRSNTHIFTGFFLAEAQVDVLDVLKQEELVNLVYCFYKSKHTPRKYKKIFECVLTRLLDSESSN